MRIVLLWSSLCLFACANADQAYRVIVTIHGDRVEYDQEQRTVAVEGQVQITARSDKPGAPTLAITAEQLEGDLQHGLLIAAGGIKLLSQQAAFVGQKMQLDFKRNIFVLEKGAASADMPSPQYPGQIVRGYFFGDKLGRDAEIFYVIAGRVTTCDRAHPHYAIGAKRLVYDSSRNTLRIEHGQIRLPGLSLTLPGTVTLPIGELNGAERLHLMLPQYSAYDGLYLPIWRRWELPHSPWQIEAYLNVGTRLRLPAGLLLTNSSPNEQLTVSVTRREERLWDINQRSYVDALPELRYLRRWERNKAQDAGARSQRRPPALEGEIFAGYLQEHLSGQPLTEALRTGLALRFTPQPEQRRRRQGLWTAAALAQMFYDTGDRLTDLRLELGLGWRLNKSLRGAFWAVHHAADGQSPFAFDNVYVKNEGFASLAWEITERHRLQLYGHYDFERTQLRDYSVRYSYRAHCLTWSLQYNFAREALTLGLDLNGLTGDTQPPSTAPLVRPEEMPPLPEPAPASGAAAMPTATSEASAISPSLAAEKRE